MGSNFGNDDGPHPVDAYVGARVRLRRTYLGFSQERLANSLGLAFQQIQKYERGVNRISASKLFELAVLLDVPVGFFFEGAEDTMGRAPEGALRKGNPAIPDPDSASDRSLTAQRETTQLISSFHRINDAGLRQGVLALVKSLGKVSHP